MPRTIKSSHGPKPTVHIRRVARRPWPSGGPTATISYKRPHKVALLEIKNLHVALEDGTEIVTGVDLP